MPLDADPLPAPEIAKLRAWIDQGATMPAASAALEDSIEQHWAYVKPKRPATPEVTRKDWVRNPIDAFVLGGSSVSSCRRRRKRQRRRCWEVSFDLIGLPPTPEEVDAFLADKSPEAYTRRSSIACWRRRTSASAGRGRGSISRATPTPTATRRTTAATSGRIATGSSTRSTATCHSTSSPSSRSPATCCRTRRSSRRSPRVPSQRDDQRGRRRRPRVALRGPCRSREHDGDRLARQHARLRAVPQPQVRPLHAEHFRLLSFFANNDYDGRGFGDGTRYFEPTLDSHPEQEAARKELQANIERLDQQLKTPTPGGAAEDLEESLRTSWTGWTRRRQCRRAATSGVTLHPADGSVLASGVNAAATATPSLPACLWRASPAFASRRCRMPRCREAARRDGYGHFRVWVSGSRGTHQRRGRPWRPSSSGP